MIFPASILRVRIVANGRKKLGLWVPLLLLWPLALALAPLLVLAALVYMLRQRRAGRRTDAIRCLPLLCRVAFSLRGLKVEVQKDNQEILVSFL
jgi:membrane protein implicated in regulation of membrane protease activity